MYFIIILYYLSQFSLTYCADLDQEIFEFFKDDYFEGQHEIVNEINNNERCSSFVPNKKARVNRRDKANIRDQFNSESIESEKILSEPQMVLEEIKAKFYEEYPTDQKFSLRKYKIENWPEDVNEISAVWTGPQIKKIRSQLSSFRFVQREKKISVSDQLGLNGIDFPRDYDKKRDVVMAELLERFRMESKNENSDSIDWKQLDRSNIPMKYNDIRINGRTITLSQLFKNSEIVHNIHFHPYSEEELEAINNRDRSNQLDNEIYQKILEVFRTETGVLNATKINWDRVDKTRLPENYKHLKITGNYVAETLRDHPAIIEHIHFRRYSSKYFNELTCKKNEI